MYNLLYIHVSLRRFPGRLSENCRNRWKRVGRKHVSNVYSPKNWNCIESISIWLDNMASAKYGDLVWLPINSNAIP